MAGFIDYEITTDEQTLIAEVFENLSVEFAGWEPSEGHLEVVLAEELLRKVVELMVVAANVPLEIFRKFGQDLLGIAADDGTPATAESTWTAIDDAGYTIVEGTVIAYMRSGDELWEFRNTTEVVIPPASTQALGVVIEASEVGTFANGIPVATEMVIVDQVSWLESVVLTTATSGGAAAETTEGYLDRLAERLRTLADRPIIPADFPILAQSITGVHRAVAINGYDPDLDTDGNEKTIAIAAVDEDGVAVAAGVKTALEDYFEAKREANFVVKVMDPTYTDIDVVFVGVAETGYDAAAVEAAAEAAVTTFLDPGVWGGGDQSPPEWRLDTVLRYQDLVAVLNAVPGFAYYTTLTVEAGVIDVNLTGRAPLPSAVGVGGSTVAGTVA